MTRPLPLAARRRTSVSPEFDALEQIHLWLDTHRRTDRLDPAPDGGHVHLHRRTARNPWAEVGRYPTVLAFGQARAIVDRRTA